MAFGLRHARGTDAVHPRGAGRTASRYLDEPICTISHHSLQGLTGHILHKGGFQASATQSVGHEPDHELCVTGLLRDMQQNEKSTHLEPFIAM